VAPELMSESRRRRDTSRGSSLRWANDFALTTARHAGFSGGAWNSTLDSGIADAAMSSWRISSGAVPREQRQLTLAVHAAAGIRRMTARELRGDAVVRGWRWSTDPSEPFDGRGVTVLAAASFGAFRAALDAPNFSK